MKLNPQFEYLDAHEIVPRLYQGAAPTHPLEMQEVCDHFHVLVLCAEEFQPDRCMFPNIHVIHGGFDDNDLGITDRELDIAKKTACEVAYLHQQGKRVLVTCMAGINRSGLVVALALRILQPDKRAQEIVDLIRKNRVIDYKYALYNKSFVSAIRAFRDNVAMDSETKPA